jgi:hypothetical protein
MTFRLATGTEVTSVEETVDNSFMAGLNKPAPDRVTALRFVLAVAEDRQRLPLLAFRDQRAAHYVGWGIICDNMKYALKDALSQLMALPALDLPPPDTIESNQYAAAATFLEACEKYQVARTAFATFHAGNADCRIEDTGKILKFRQLGDMERYDVLDILLGTIRPDTPSSPLQLWFAGVEDPPEACWSAGAHATPVGSARLNVPFEESVAREFLDLVPSVPGVLPAQWTANGWGNGAQLQIVFRALQAVAMYHLVTVLLGAGLHEVPQAAVASALLEASISEIAERVALLAATDRDLVLKVVRSLVYGRGVQTPDPALQPLVPTGIDERVILSPMLILTSNMPRNFLSLLQRIDGPAFHSASAAFERDMIARMEPPLRENGRRIIQQMTVTPASTTRLARIAERVLPAPVPDQFPRRLSLRSRAAIRRCIRFGG